MDWEAAYREHGVFGGPPPWNIGEPQPEIAALIRAGKIRSEVLDAGCGVAELSLTLATLGHTVMGVDVSGTAIDKAKQAANDRGLSTVTFVQDDLTSLRGCDGRFNTIIDSTLFESLPIDSRDDYIRSVHRVAAPGASYYVLVSTVTALPADIELPPDAPAAPPNLVTEPELREAVSRYWEIDEVRPAFIHVYLSEVLSRIPGVSLADYEVDAKNRLKVSAFLLTAHKAGQRTELANDPHLACLCEHEPMPRQPSDPGELSLFARWSIVVVALLVTASSFLFINGVAFLIPRLEAARGTPLTQAGLLASMPSWGMVVTLVAWGYVLDRVGERVVMTVGSALTAVAAYAAASVHSLTLMGIYLFLGGMAAASCNSAGGRLVAGWFPPHQRGLAMGIRQTAQPLGIALGALVIPELAEQGVHAGLMFPAVACTVAAVASLIGVADAPRKSRKVATDEELASPYRGSSVLWRIHAVSALLMMPQTVTVTFMLVWLMNRHGWSVAAAGGLVTVSQLLGALGRIAVGRWSDYVGSRMRPVRIIAVAAASALFLLALTDNIGSRYDVLLMIAISVIAVLDNGLEATAITEFAGPYWSGRALGTQNTTQRLMAATGPPLFGALITTAAYPLAWALWGLFPLAAVPLVPVRLLPPGLETRARRQSIRRHRWRQAVRARELPTRPRLAGPPRPSRPCRGGRAPTPPT